MDPPRDSEQALRVVPAPAMSCRLLRQVESEEALPEGLLLHMHLYTHVGYPFAEIRIRPSRIEMTSATGSSQLLLRRDDYGCKEAIVT